MKLLLLQEILKGLPEFRAAPEVGQGWAGATTVPIAMATCPVLFLSRMLVFYLPTKSEVRTLPQRWAQYRPK